MKKHNYYLFYAKEKLQLGNLDNPLFLEGFSMAIYCFGLENGGLHGIYKKTCMGTKRQQESHLKDAEDAEKF